MEGGPRVVALPEWARPFAAHRRYKSARGGRASGKTWTFARLIAARAANEPIRVACGREFQSSIKVSAKPALEIAIRQLGLSDRFVVQEQTIRGRNGSFFFFRGLERNRDEIRGWEDVDLVWVEEAQRLSEESARVLIPTIRKPGSELWFSWNPKYRSDWAWRRFVLSGRPDDLSVVVNYNDNGYRRRRDGEWVSWLPPEADDERRYDRRFNPDLYAHIWEGHPDDTGAERKLLPYAMLSDCVEAYGKYAEQATGMTEVGLDVADTGVDMNAVVVRRGPCVEYVDEWRAKIISETSWRAHGVAAEHGATRLYYDAGGPGAGVRSDFAKMADRPYVVRPELFGGRVKGKAVRFSYRVANEEFFARRNAQMGWALRLRAQATGRLLAGEDVDIDRCLFISPKIRQLEKFLAQMTQPAWRENPVTGKTELMKRDEEKEPSPDMYDACALAFAHDSEHGLKARV